MVELQQGLAQVAASMRAGDFRAVEAQLAQLELVHPRSADVRELWAAHFFKLGMPERARDSIEAALRLDEASAALRCRLGRMLHAMNDGERAADLFDQATRLAPAMAEAWQLLGYVRAGQGRWRDATRALRQAHLLAPDDLETLKRLSDLEFDHGMPLDALPVMERLSTLMPADIDAQLKLGVIFGRLFDHRRAVEHYREVLQRLSGSADLWMALGQSLEYLGEREESERCYRQALELRQGWALPLSALLGLLRRQVPADLLADAERLLAQPGMADAERATLAYELGKCHDAEARYADAMRCWNLANQLRQHVIGPLNAAEVRSLVRRSVDGFGARPRGAAFAQSGAARGSHSPEMVFVVGMPRSGTTLTEQIIAAHPLAHGCGELLDLTLIANRLGEQSNAGWPEAAGDIADADAVALAAEYLRSASRHAAAGSRVLVDKAPLNFFFLGLAARLFPSARVIWCRRDPRDIAISIYGENFSLDAPFATSFLGIAEYLDAEATLMAHWRQVLELDVLEVHYEELVADTEVQSRRLIEFVGLSWDPACLDFHQTASVVQTPSRWQVRQPAHRRSVGRWRNYSQWLREFEARLISRQ